MLFTRVIGLVLGAGSLASAWGCGSVVVDEADTGGTTSQGQAGGGEGGGATGGAPSTSTGVAGADPCGPGVKVDEEGAGPEDEPCACGGSVGILVASDCGSTKLVFPYLPFPVYCDAVAAFSYTTECKDKYSFEVLGCAGPSQSPCLRIGTQTGEGEPSWGVWIDGAGDEWVLSDIEMPGAMLPQEPNVKGTFSAAATRADGTTQQIGGEYDLCVNPGPVCPI